MNKIVELKILCDADGIPQSGIVRMTKVEDGRVLAKYALDTKANWAQIPEAMPYPSGYFLPIVETFKFASCQKCGEDTIIALDEQNAICSRCQFEAHDSTATPQRTHH
jgi:ribosomal protein S27AE